MRAESMLSCPSCRLGTAIVFLALYYKSFVGAKQPPPAPRASPSKVPLKSPSRSPLEARSGKLQWDMEAAGKHS